MSSTNLPVTRFAFLEMLAYWLDEVRNKDLENQFSITRQQAYKDFTLYQEIHPESLIKIDKAHYGFSDGWLPHYYLCGFDDFFIWLETGHFRFTPHLSDTCALQMRLPERKISRHVVATLIKAIRQRLRVEANYVSLSNPEHEGRLFSPHSIVKAGSRFHVRGYCEKSHGFRDLVLSRFRDDIELEGPSHHAIEQDLDWQMEVTLILSPDPRLNRAQQDVIANDYQMISD
jgi:hypothetical protein